MEIDRNKGFIIFSIIMFIWFFFACMIIVCFIVMYFNGQMEYIRNTNNVSLNYTPSYEKVEILRNEGAFDKNSHDIYLIYQFSNIDGTKLERYFAEHSGLWKNIKNYDVIIEKNDAIEKVQKINSGYFQYKEDYQYKNEDDVKAEKEKKEFIGKTLCVFDSDKNELHYISYTF